MTVGEWLRQAQQRLSWTDSPSLEAQLLAAHVLLVDRSWLMAHPEAEFNELAGEVLLQRREGHEPLAYILGCREFYGRSFHVNPAVLIPRQDTECLVEAALEFGALEGKLRVLDLGTGSGAIGITLKLERIGWSVTCSDVSEPALDVAMRNARDLGAEVRWVRSNLFSEFVGESFDLIVSNPPYIGDDEVLPREVWDYEPKLALFAGPRGVGFYELLAEQAADYLVDGGRVIVEIGYAQAAPVTELFMARNWTKVQTRKDLSGNDRVVEFAKTWECGLHYASENG